MLYVSIDACLYVCVLVKIIIKEKRGYQLESGGHRKRLGRGSMGGVGGHKMNG